jgi:Apea-like HEPN
MPLQFVGILANAHTSVAYLDFAPCVCRVWTYEKLVRFVAREEGLPKWSIYPRVDMDFAVYRNRRGNVCVLEGASEVPEGNTDDDFWTRHQREEALVRLIETRIRLLRLFEAGSLMLIAHYFYEQHGRRTEPISQAWWASGPAADVFTVSKSRARWLNRKVAEMPIQFEHEYLNLALTSLDRSYRESDHIVAFLMLMIGFEALFNAGKQELRYRLCRGLAILCGRTIGERQAIFDRARKVYDRRSILLHTGKQDHITDADVSFIRHHLRGAILAACNLNLLKDALSVYLTEAGFQSVSHAQYHD